jgi:aspartyl-tRNA(Asn)/glutamyl-tRNA(Gln) amidotransferase subunit A
MSTYKKRVSDQLAAISKLNNSVHAVTSVFEEAVEQGEAADEAAKRGEWQGLLAGTTVGIKDVIDTAGHLTTMGSQFFADHVPAKDAEVVSRLRRAGAILIAKTNLSEFAMGATSQNPHFGYVANAWVTDCVAGGSSGGSAVAVAAGLADVALGTDTGGSILVPSALNGLVGLRPSVGRVSNRGVFPVSTNFDTVGPIARTVADARRTLAAIEGKDPLDLYQRPPSLPIAFGDLGTGIEGIRIGVARNHFVPEEPEIAAALEAALSVLSNLGAIVEDFHLEGAEDAPANMARQMFADFLIVHEERFATAPDKFGEDVRFRLGLGAKSTGLDYAKGRQWTQRWRSTLARTFEKYDVVATPTTPITAPPIAESTTIATSPILTRFTHPWCLSEGPTLTLPAGISRQGKPIGFQISGPAMAERELFRIGASFQSATDWHTRRPAIAAH